MDPADVRFCMRCLDGLQVDTKKVCFKCNRVTCSKRECGIWAVINRFWSCQICVDEEVNAMIDLHETKQDN